MGFAFEMSHITKVYGTVRANDDISIKAEEGTVLCIIGENGAGKSTLMNILYGMEKPDGGEIQIAGKKAVFHSSRDAMKNHIGMVFQHFMLIQELSCLENIIIGMEPSKGLLIDRKESERQIREIMSVYNMELPLDAKAGTLGVGQQQKLEIVKVLYRGANIIILDEPTAVLTPQETKELFFNIKKLTKMGKTVILITHKLDEVMQIADNIYVMRAGKLITEVKPEDTDIHKLSIHMVGKEIPPMRERAETQKEEALRLTDICLNHPDGLPALENISMVLKKGEILGIAGISGNGQTELAKVITGLCSPLSGRVQLNEKDITSHDRKRRILDGISFIPEDRNSTGVSLSWSIEDNCFCGYEERFCGRFGIIDRRKTTEFAKKLIEKFRVKTPDGGLPISSLSGGNCQKVIVARETAFDPEVIVAAEPSRGVDIGAISTIHNYMIELRNQGTAVLLLSSSLDELFELSDRIAVIFEGRITAVLDPKDITREEIGLYMSGAKKGGELVW